MGRTTKKPKRPKDWKPFDGTLGTLAPGSFFRIGDYSGRVCWVMGETVFVEWLDHRGRWPMEANNKVDWHCDHDVEYIDGGDADDDDIDPLKGGK